MRDSDSSLDKAQRGLYPVEHFLAWFYAGGAIVLGAIGLLIGFEVLDFRSGADEPVGGLPGNFLDGAMWMFAGITSAIHAFTLHSTQHHRSRAWSSVSKSDRALGSFEHSMAYVVALGSVALLIVGFVAGYSLFGFDGDQVDGLLWIWGGFGAGILAATLHKVQHHQEAEADEIIAIVTERVRASGPVAGERQTRPTR